MNVQFALDYIPRRMKELGYGNEYITRWRTLQVNFLSNVIIQADNEYFILVDPDSGITVRSKTGLYDSFDTSLNELQFEHKGKIEITNNTESNLFVQFIQVIPNHQK